MAKKTKKEANFEDSLEKLETIVDQMEDGSLSLEEMMSHFEEGMKLVKFCSGKLNEFERKIELLVKSGEELTTEDFDEPEIEELDEE